MPFEKLQRNRLCISYRNAFFAEKVWETSEVDMRFWAGQFRSMRDCIGRAVASMDKGELGIFVAIMACYAAHNVFVFQAKETNSVSLSQQSRDLVQGLREVNTSSHSSTTTYPQS